MKHKEIGVKHVMEVFLISRREGYALGLLLGF